MTKSELVEVQSQNSKLRADVDALQDELDREREQHEDAVSEVRTRHPHPSVIQHARLYMYACNHLIVFQVNKRGEELSSQDRILTECRQQIIVLEGEGEQTQQTVQRLQLSLDDYKQKYQVNMEHIAQLEGALQRTQENLDDAKNREQELQNETYQLQQDLERASFQRDDKAAKLTRAEDVIEQLTRELNTSQDDLDRTNERVAALERDLEKQREDYERIQDEVITGFHTSTSLCNGIKVVKLRTRVIRWNREYYVISRN